MHSFLDLCFKSCRYPEEANRILDNLYNLAEHFSGNADTAYQLKKWTSMSIMQLIWRYDDREMPDEEHLFVEFLKQLHWFAENMFELYDFDFVVNRAILTRNCKKCQKLLHTILGNRASRESHERIDFICNFISNEKFLKYAFDSNSAFNRATIEDIIRDLRSLMEKEIF